MTRTTLYKAHYFAVMGSVLVLWLIACFVFTPSPLVIVLAGFALFVPGRILGYFWRDLLRGLRLLNARQFIESKKASEAFLADYQRRRWIRHLVWLGSSSYSHNPEVLALNNLGAAELNLGELDAARAHLERAIPLDPLCPLLFFNLANVAEAQGQAEEAMHCFETSAKLGYTRGLSDKIVTSSQARFAKRDG